MVSVASGQLMLPPHAASACFVSSLTMTLLLIPCRPHIQGILWQGAAASPENSTLCKNPVARVCRGRCAALSPLHVSLSTNPVTTGLPWQGAAVSPGNLSLYERWAGVGGARGGQAAVELGERGEGDGARLLSDSGVRAG